MYLYRDYFNTTWVHGPLGSTHRPQSSSFLGLPYRILFMNPQEGTTLGPMGMLHRKDRLGWCDAEGGHWTCQRAVGTADGQNPALPIIRNIP